MTTYIIKTEAGLFCGWHEYVQYDSMGVERWNDVFPYFEGNKGNPYPIERYDSYEDAKKAAESLEHVCDDIQIVEF